MLAVISKLDVNEILFVWSTNIQQSPLPHYHHKTVRMWSNAELLTVLTNLREGAWCWQENSLQAIPQQCRVLPRRCCIHHHQLLMALQVGFAQAREPDCQNQLALLCFPLRIWMCETCICLAATSLIKLPAEMLTIYIGWSRSRCLSLYLLLSEMIDCRKVTRPSSLCCKFLLPQELHLLLIATPALHLPL